MTTIDEAMSALEAAGTEQTRKTYRRHGATDPLFGVKFGDLRPMGRRIGRDQDLADALWQTGNADARLLACMVADPDRASEDGLDSWLADIDNYFLVDIFVAEIATKVPGVVPRAERWIASDRDRTAQAGWDLLNFAALNEDDVSDELLEERLGTIAERMDGYGNWTRRAASGAITGIGLRNPHLESVARETAASMGDVEFDPGQTSCVMPDPIVYLEKTKAHRAKQAAKRS